MNGYGVNDWTCVASLGGLLASIPLIGFAIGRSRSIAFARTANWLFTIGVVVLVERFSGLEPAGTRMLLLIIAALWGMKSIVLAEVQHRNRYFLSFSSWIMFTVFWLGMRPGLFKPENRKECDDWGKYISKGMTRLFGGGVLIYIARLLWISNVWTEEVRQGLATLLLLSGISLGAHFGALNILAGVWRYAGVRVSSLFRAPQLSCSLAEFWGKRWNLAFSEMTAIAVFRPMKQCLVKSRFGRTISIVMAFGFSGLLHELAISVPVQSDYGWPLLYFVIHAIGVQLEAYVIRQESNWLANRWVDAVGRWLGCCFRYPSCFIGSFLRAVSGRLSIFRVLGGCEKTQVGSYLSFLFSVHHAWVRAASRRLPRLGLLGGMLPQTKSLGLKEIVTL